VLSFGKSNITVKNVYLTLHLQIIYLGVLQRSLNVEFGRWPFPFSNFGIRNV
jgi:hypothetical protein